MNILEVINEQKAILLGVFSPDCYPCDTEREYPSYVTALFRLFINYFHFIYPALWLILFIDCIVSGFSFFRAILPTLLLSLFYLVLIVLAFFLLMALESFSKLLASLILSGKLPPEGSENPIDFFLMELFKGDIFRT